MKCSTAMASRSRFRAALPGIALAALVLVIGAALPAFTQPPADADLHGTWAGAHRDTRARFRFDSAGTCLLTFSDAAGGVRRELRGDYDIDTSRRPIPLTIRNVQGLPHPLHAVVEFAGLDTLRLAPFAPRNRLRALAVGHDRAIVLTRVRADAPAATH